MSINLKQEYLNFFKSKGHAIIPSASIVPENDPTCLFVTAGMQPLVPYLMGQPHPSGKRLCNVQKSFRLNDVESVGNSTHHTFFEMLGNWSLGDYFKKESIAYSFEFLTKVLKIPVDKLAVTVFEGNSIVKADDEAAQVWQSLGIKKERIAYLPAEDNWWPAFDAMGPCGSDSEIFYYRPNTPTPKVYDPKDKNWVEIWNNVFMTYTNTPSGMVELKQKNIDTGMGVERVTALLQGTSDNYMTPLFRPIIQEIENISKKTYPGNERPMRIIADHLRAVVIILSDKAQILPSNSDQGYILRRLIRRILRYARMLDIDLNSNFEKPLLEATIKLLSHYDEVGANKTKTIETFVNEKQKFARTLEKGLKELDKITQNSALKTIDGVTAFKLFDTYGFPIEMTTELAAEKNLTVDKAGFDKCFKEHQEKSRAGSEQKFKGGLADSSDATTALHTATHLLLAALRQVLGKGVFQRGSNITPERLRFDFSFERKMTDEEIKQVEKIVNEVIAKNIEVKLTQMKLVEAKKLDIMGIFDDKYQDIVNVYTIGEFSKELCGGPHAASTGLLGKFTIQKEESSSAGVRRIKAVLS